MQCDVFTSVIAVRDQLFLIGVRFQLIYFSTKSGAHATPGRSPLTAAARQCSRRPARHGVVRSTFSPTAFPRLKKSSFNQIHHRGRQRGRFFRAKAQKKIAPDGRSKRDFNEPPECQHIRMVGQSVTSMNRRNANPFGCVGKSVTSMNHRNANISGWSAKA